jgi:hypothetical protein
MEIEVAAGDPSAALVDEDAGDVVSVGVVTVDELGVVADGVAEDDGAASAEDDDEATDGDELAAAGADEDVAAPLAAATICAV